jgi:hypothetical protein
MKISRQFATLCLIFLSLATLGGCSTSTATRADLLGTSYRAITDNYVEPLPSSTIALASLRGLAQLNDAIAVTPIGEDLALSYSGRVIARFRAPPSPDWQGWGEIAAQITAVAVSASPTLAQLESKTVDSTLLDAGMAVLDRFSRYEPPEAVPLDLVDQNELDEPVSSKVVGDARSGPSFDAVFFPSAEVEFADGIAVIRIRCFAKATSQILSSRLAAVLGNPAVALRGFVLDLRDNPGGNITSMAAIADLFMDRGTIVSFDGRNPRDRFSITATAKSTAYQRIPMVVLINGRTISAAEVLAAALQGNGRAVVIGTPSYGKGIAQSQIPLPNGGRLWLSSVRMSAPAGYLLHYHGVVPDVCTTLAADDRESYQAAIERPRGSLSEVDWKMLRQVCPQASDRDAIDRDRVELATRALSRL